MEQIINKEQLNLFLSLSLKTIGKLKHPCMDILTHALSGTAVAACTSTFVKTTPLRRAKILFVGTLGGILPDLDAISLWSRFDATFGKLFHLSHTGKEIYSMKLWYSHHAFLHSLLSSILFGAILMLIIYSFGLRKKESHVVPPKKTFIYTHVIYFITFVLGYWAHLAGDLPTPSSAWGGIGLWWPSLNYIGGFGKIWWWNNYDIFLLIVSCTLIILIVPFFFKSLKKYARLFSVAMLSITFCLILIQVNNRKYNYSSPGQYVEKEQSSKKEQERILGKKVYSWMVWFDNKLKFYF